jgi:hypothetical protein
MFWPFHRNPNLIKLIVEAEMTTPEGQALVQAIEALPAAFAAAAAKGGADLQAKLDAANAALTSEQQNHADDLAAASTAVQQITPPATSS